MRLSLDDVTFISEEAHKEIYRRCPAKKGDVLYIKDGATTGIAAINPLEEEFSILSSVAVLRGKPHLLDNRFLAYWLNSPRGKRYMLGMVAGVAITRLTLAKLNDAEIPLPPLEEQRRIVAEIEGYQKVLDGAREILAGYRAQIPDQQEWPVVELRERQVRLMRGDRVVQLRQRTATRRARDKICQRGRMCHGSWAARRPVLGLQGRLPRPGYVFRRSCTSKIAS